MGIRAAVLACVFALYAACDPVSSTPPPAPPGIDFVRCGEVETGVGDQGGGAERPRHKYCGQLTVLDSAGSDRTLQLLLISDQDALPLADRSILVYHPGGPGISAVELLGQDPPEVDLTSHVVLTWDGTTASLTPGACGPESVMFGTDRILAELGRTARIVGEECLAGFAGPEDIGALAAADELEAIRRALSIDQLDLLTISYGTAIAEAYLRTHPSSVRRAVLDAPMVLEAPWPDRLAAVGRALTDGAARLAQGCTTPGCQSITPAGGVLSYALIRRAVLEAHPAVGAGDVILTATVFEQAALLTLRSPASWAAWGEAVDAALAGDGTALWSLGEKEYFDLDRAVFYRSLCADIDRPSNAAAYAAPADPFLVAYTSELAPCVVYPHRDLPAAAAPGPVPDLLVIASSHDVLAPAGLLDSAPVLRGLAAICVTDVMGHTSYRAPGVAELASRFLATGDAAVAAASCG